MKLTNKRKKTFFINFLSSLVTFHIDAPETKP